MTPGKVILVGAGPGDPGLLTLRGREALLQADVVVHDRLVGGGVMELIPAGCRLVDVGKNAGHHPVPQHEINQILVDLALQGLQVVRLKGGDSFLFGRGGEELEALVQRGIPFEVVPGITSALAAPCYAGIPVTHRDYCSSLHIITGHKKSDGQLELDYGALVRLKGTLVFLMSVASIPAIAQGLLDAGMDPSMPAAVVENGTRPGQRSFIAAVGTIAQVVRERQVQSPSVILVGRVASLAAQFNWFDRLPLQGRRILVTRPREQAPLMAARLREQGAQVDLLPTIQLEAVPFALPPAESFDVLALTSAAGARYFLAGLLAQGKDARWLSGKRIAVVGSQTAAALKSYGLLADFIPTEFSGETMGREMCQGFLRPGDRVLIACAQGASPDLPRALDQGGAAHSQLVTYRTLHPRQALPDPSAYDVVTFTSGSTVDGFVGCCPPDTDFAAVNALCIGSRTAGRARAFGMKVTVAPEATIDSMIHTLMGGLCHD